MLLNQIENLVQHRIVFVIIQYFKYTKENVSTNQASLTGAMSLNKADMVYV